MLLSMGCNPSVADDLVQEMYIKLDQYLKTHKKNIMYKDEINYFFVYVTLRNLYMDYIRQKNKVDVISLDDTSYFIELRKNQYEEYKESKTKNELDKHLSIQEWYNDDLYLELLEKETDINVAMTAVDYMGEIGEPEDIPLLESLKERFKDDYYAQFAVDGAIKMIEG